MEELELDTTFILTYAETCSKARIDEFAGGGFRVKRGQPIHRISAGWFLHSISEDGQINPAQLQPEPYSYKKGWFNRKEGIAEMLRVDLEYLESFKGEADGPF